MLSDFFDHKTYLMLYRPFDNAWSHEETKHEEQHDTKSCCRGGLKISIFYSGNTLHNDIHRSSVQDE